VQLERTRVPEQAHAPIVLLEHTLVLEHQPVLLAQAELTLVLEQHLVSLVQMELTHSLGQCLALFVLLDNIKTQQGGLLVHSVLLDFMVANPDWAFAARVPQVDILCLVLQSVSTVWLEGIKICPSSLLVIFVHKVFLLHLLEWVIALHVLQVYSQAVSIHQLAAVVFLGSIKISLANPLAASALLAGIKDNLQKLIAQFAQMGVMRTVLLWQLALRVLLVDLKQTPLALRAQYV
jgi:hypothetical protein